MLGGKEIDPSFNVHQLKYTYITFTAAKNKQAADCNKAIWKRVQSQHAQYKHE